MKKLLTKGTMICLIAFLSINSIAQTSSGAAGEAYANMPGIPPIGVRIEKHLEIPESAKGPAIDPAKGYRLQKLGKDLYMITDNALQCMFMVYEKGVVLVDAPESLAPYIKKAIAEVTDKPITHFIYSHSHADHVGGAGSLNFGKNVMIIGHEETKKLLVRANDPARPVPTVTFKDKYILEAGSQMLELSYHGNAHEPGNIFIGEINLARITILGIGWIDIVGVCSDS